MPDSVEIDTRQFKKDIELGELVEFDKLLADPDSGCIGQIVLAPRLNDSGQPTGTENVVFQKIIEDEHGVRELHDSSTTERFFARKKGSELTDREMKGAINEPHDVRILVDVTGGKKRALVFAKK